MGVVTLKQIYVYFRTEQRSETLISSGPTAPTVRERSYRYKTVRGKNDRTRLFPRLSPEKAVTSHDTLVAMSAPSFQILGSNITPTKELL